MLAVVNLRATKKAIRNGSWVLDDTATWEVVAPSEFQRLRLTEAVSIARIYLEESNAGEVAEALGRTAERAAQMVRTGIKYMVQVGWLRPAGRDASVPRKR
jgi:hypothetical protein